VRILITSWPAWGHLFPMFPLARAAQLAGHDLVFASGADVVPGLRQAGFTAWAVGPSQAQAVAARRPADESEPSPTWEQRVAADMRDMFVPADIRRAEELLPLAQEWRPDLVVHAAGDVSGAAAAAVLGVPSVMHGLGLVPPGFERLLEPLFSTVGESLGVTGLADRILQGTLLDLTPASLLPPGYSERSNRQPLRTSAGEIDPDPAVAAAIAALPFPRTVYLTLGTIMNNRPGVMEAALTGILDFPVNVVVTTGRGFDNRRLGSPPAHVLVREHIGQATVLAECSAVISHTGSGTMYGAMSFGLPQLALPMGADQPYNAATLERVGAGLRLDPPDLAPESVRNALMRILDEASFTVSARRLQDEITEMPTAPEVVGLLESRLIMAS